MFDKLRDLAANVKDALGIETPQLPVDLGTAAEGVESVTQAGSAAVTDVPAGLGEEAGGFADTAAAAVTDAGTGLDDTAAAAIADAQAGLGEAAGGVEDAATEIRPPN